MATKNLVEVRTPMPDNSREARAKQALAAMETFTITSAADYQSAAAELARIKGQWNEVDKERQDLKAPSLDGCRRVDAFFSPALSFLSKAESIIKCKLDVWSKAQRTIALAAQQKAEAEARREREKLQQRAAKAETTGKLDKAESLQQQAAMIVAPVIIADVPKVAGLSNRQVWKYRIVDQAKLPREYLMPDEKKIAGVARAMRADTNIPGIEVYPDTSFASSAA